MLRDSSLIPLSHQHQHGLALTVIIERGLKADRSPEKAAELSRKVADMWKAELKGHFQVEEEVLFPGVRTHLQSDAIVDELIEQHRDLEALIERLAASPAKEQIALLTTFGELLSRHIRVEERQLFQQIQERLSEEELKSLGARIDESVQRICPVSGGLPWEQEDR